MSIQVPYFDKNGKALEPIEIDEATLGGLVRRRLLKEAILIFEANQRVGTHKVKTRAEVAGTNAKPWRQKGTGRARAGTVRSPIWRGGGVTHGPNPRSYRQDMPKKKKRVALQIALLAKLKDNEVICVESFGLEARKTRDAVSLLQTIGIEGKCLIGLEAYDKALHLSFRNIPHLRIDEVRNFNPHQMIGGGTILVTRAALDALLAKVGEEVTS